MSIIWEDPRLLVAPEMYPAPELAAPGVQSVFFESMSYEGRPTRSFAYMGVPKRTDGKPVPGMVLVHGGGGTAFDSWVRLWNSRGYAAIAVDTCGALPKPDPKPGEARPRHDFSGPNGWGDFDSIAKDPKDQWTYHAVADVMLAHSLLRAQPGVDANRIGMTGISWGGYLTSIAASVDERIAFAMPVYGCGFLYEDSVWKYESFPKMEPSARDRWLEWWDPKHYLPKMNRPMCWLNGTNDFAYFMESHQRSYRLPSGPRTVCIRFEMPHGHGGLGENPRELHVFADAMCKGEQPLARFVACLTEEKTLVATYESSRPIMRAELLFTRATGYGADRKYNVIPATHDANACRVSATIPLETTACFLNIYDDRDCVVSTEMQMF